MRVRNTKQVAEALGLSIQKMSREAREGRLKVADCSAFNARTFSDETLAMWLLQDSIKKAKKLDLSKKILIDILDKLWKGVNE